METLLITFAAGFIIALFMLSHSTQPPQIIYLQSEESNDGGLGWLLLVLLAVVIIVLAGVAGPGA